MKYNYSNFIQKATLKLNWETKEKEPSFKNCCALHLSVSTKFTRIKLTSMPKDLPWGNNLNEESDIQHVIAYEIHRSSIDKRELDLKSTHYLYER